MFFIFLIYWWLISFNILFWNLENDIECDNAISIGSYGGEKFIFPHLHEQLFFDIFFVLTFNEIYIYSANIYTYN